MNKFFYFLIFIVVLLSCNNSKKSIITTKNGYELYFHILSEEKIIDRTTKIINLKILALDSSGNCVFSSANNDLGGISSFYYDSSISQSPMNEILLNLYEGDSVSFQMSSKVFFESFFGVNTKLFTPLFHTSLKVHLKLLVYNNSQEQTVYIRNLQNLAIENEIQLLKKERAFWDSNFLNISKINDIYAVKLDSDDSFSMVNDSLDSSIGLYYSLCDIIGREIYKTPNFEPEYYEANTDGQLLDGFKTLINTFNRGDSIFAIIPSKFMFKERGSYVNKIPPYCPLKVNLRIH
jgi:hypothetical protein